MALTIAMLAGRPRIIKVSATYAEVNTGTDLFTAETGWIIDRVWIRVTTDFASSGDSAILGVGEDGGDDDGFLRGVTATAGGNEFLADPADATLWGPLSDMSLGVYLWASGPKCRSYVTADSDKDIKIQNVGSGTFTAGGCDLAFRLMAP
jgi:hypothetical protein